MLLIFPHLGRCYDSTRKGIRFYGCDHTIEIPFFIEQDALLMFDADEHTSDAGYLRTFDANRERICDVASDVYSRQPKQWYGLLLP